MLKLHELVCDPGRQQPTKRRGRGEGSGLGKSAGHGNKGKQARSGSGKGPNFEGGQMPLMRRLPKYGFTNKRFRAKRAEVSLGQLEAKFEAGATVDMDAMRAAGLIAKQTERVRVLVGGSFSKTLNVKASGFSAGARAAIEAAGGRCETES
ncbi:50S ribosomal protein L15 [bacterium]|nr:50S ribosomal protein L15 [bacterium]